MTKAIGRAWRRATGRPGVEGGMVTAETAAALPALMGLTALMLFVIGAVGAQLRCVDLSREAVRELARGEDPASVTRNVLADAPPDARLTVARSGGTVTATVSGQAPVLGPLAARLGGLMVHARASALDETTIGLAP